MFNASQTLLYSPATATLDVSGGTTVTVGYEFDARTLAIGTYSGQFSLTMLNGDAQLAVVTIQVISNAAGATTFDITTDRGQVRSYMQDTGEDGTWIFTDAKIDSLLAFANGGVAPTIPNTMYPWLIYKAVSLGFRQNSSNKAYIAKLAKTGQFQFDTKTSYQAMIDQANTFLRMALDHTLPLVNPIPVPQLPVAEPNPDYNNPISITPTPTSVMSYW